LLLGEVGLDEMELYGREVNDGLAAQVDRNEALSRPMK
jgi:hypothetical protein